MLLLKPLHEHIHVQHAEEAAAEARAQRGARLALHGDTGVVEGERFYRNVQALEPLLAQREDACRQWPPICACLSTGYEQEHGQGVAQHTLMPALSLTGANWQTT